MSKNRELAELSDKVTVDSGNVGIGTTSPSVKAHISGSDTYMAGIESSGSYCLLGFKSSGSSGTMADPTVAVGGNGDALYFRSGGAERVRILSSGGITFNGDTSSANALDDYEEGTWTPNFEGTTTNPTITYTNREGYYTKIGNIVHCIFNIAISAKSGGSGLIEIAGLPFTVDNTGNGDGRYAGLCGVTGYSGFGTNKVDNFQVRVGSTVFRLLKNDTGGIGVLYVGDLSGDEYLTGGFSYRAS